MVPLPSNIVVLRIQCFRQERRIAEHVLFLMVGRNFFSNNSLLVSKLRVNQAWGYAYGQLDTLGALGHETFMHMILVSTRRERHQV